MFKIISKIFKILNNKKKKEFKILIVLMFVSMLLETIGIGAMIPLINFFTDGNILLPNDINLNNVLLGLGISENKILSFILTIIILVYLIKNTYIGFYSWIESRFAYKIRYDLGVNLFNKFLNNAYSFHLQTNSSNLISKIHNETAEYGRALINLSTLITEMLILFGLTSFLFIIKPQETLIIILIGLVASALFYFALKNIISILGKKRELNEREKMKSLEQGLGGIKDIIFYKAQKYFIDIFRSKSNDLSEVNFKMYFISKLPKIWFEMIAVSITIFIIFFLSFKQADTSNIMATIGIFLIASVRLMPSINRILTSLQSIKYSEAALDSLLSSLENPADLVQKKNIIKLTNKINFKNEIKFNQVSFKFPKSNKNILKNISLVIKKNQFIGIIGETGAGKSTLVDLLIGLLKPTKGSITVDGKDISENPEEWKDKLGYVPQHFYLLDESIKNNIAFGVDEKNIDMRKVERSIEKSHLTKFIVNLKDKLLSNVGERGVKVSGGERQRLSIARTLYNDPEILLFDEATSSLDADTEKKILDTLLNLKENKTIVFVTHRASCLTYCDKVFKIQNQEIKEIK